MKSFLSKLFNSRSFITTIFIISMFLGTALLAISTFTEKAEAKSPFYGFKNTLYDILVALGYGSDEPGEWGDWGEKWNRIRSAGEWLPEGSITADKVVSGETFYNNAREPQTGTLSSLLTCPEGMIPVPASVQDGLSTFCIDKYEAKNEGEVAISRPDGKPWNYINWYDANNKCKDAGKHLINEEEWLAIAHNVEKVDWNWSSGSVGLGQMSGGHSDTSPWSSLVADVTGDPDDDPCIGTGQEGVETCDGDTWNSQRRTYKLSNGEYIWDFGGNVWESVGKLNENNYPYANDWSWWIACNTLGDSICGNTETTNDQRYGGNTTDLRAFWRGGGWSDGMRSGAFSLRLNGVPSGISQDLGFRCAL